MSPAQPIDMSFASASQDAFKFSKLNGQNYATWSVHMQSLLQSQFLWLVVKGTEECPFTPSADEDEKKTYLDWVSRDEAAQGLMRSAIEESQWLHVATCTTSADMWT